MDTDAQQDQSRAEFGRQVFRAMAGTAAALIAIGVAVMFIPGSLLFHLVTGISAIACGLIVLAMGADMRRRFRRASSA
jgi:hypothetical protein